MCTVSKVHSSIGRAADLDGTPSRHLATGDLLDPDIRILAQGVALYKRPNYWQATGCLKCSGTEQVMVNQTSSRIGIFSALSAAILFGVSAPLAKELLASLSPWLLAGFLYLGSGLGLGAYRIATGAPVVHLNRMDYLWLGGAIAAGGVVGPFLLMLGLKGMPASGASLLLNAEAVLTALLAWFAFRENVDRRIALGMVLIVAGAVLLSSTSEANIWSGWAGLAVVGACLAWAIDNNLTRKVSLVDATWIATIKGMVAGMVNVSLALTVETALPGPSVILFAMLLGLVSYGISLTLFVVALRHLGTARTSAYFSIAPFVGAVAAVLMGEPPSLILIASGFLMGAGVYLHVSEHHVHEHVHPAIEHDHEHVHDEHHQHQHDSQVEATSKHRHRHAHFEVTHTHVHYPDSHHRHLH